MEELHWSLKSFSFKVRQRISVDISLHGNPAFDPGACYQYGLTIEAQSPRYPRNINIVDSTIHRKHKIQIRAILRGHYRRAQQFNAKQNKYKHKTQRSTFTIIRAQSARYQHNISTIRRMSLVCSPCDTVTLFLFLCDTVLVPV